ncbi:hypothetical protein [Planococcus dechangensis]|uniref:DUF2357 domain-containing protein n=1 Tax=Planococcus dechangensis TaxID=1176255 RepID=A0ABV9MFV0_9BACL
MSNKPRVYIPIQLNNGIEIKLNTFLSISDYFILKKITEIPQGVNVLEERLIEIFIFPEDRKKIHPPLSHEVLSYIAHELYINEFIDEKSSDLERTFELLMGNKLLEKSMKKLRLKHGATSLVQPPAIKINMDRIQSMGNSIQKTAASMTAFAQSFKRISEGLGAQLRIIGEGISRSIKELESDETDNNFIKFYLYDKCFREVDILVDDSLYFYIRDSYESIFSFVNSTPQELEDKKKYLERVFIEYWIYCIEKKPDQLGVNLENSRDVSALAFLKELKTVMGNANYISGIMLLHIYIEKVVHDKLAEFKYRDFVKTMNVKWEGNWYKASKTTKFRYILQKKLYEPLTNIQEKSIEAFEKYASLYFLLRPFIYTMNQWSFKKGMTSSILIKRQNMKN